MSQKPENIFIDGLNNLLPLRRRPRSAKARMKYPGQLIHYEKMNNPYSSGTADSWYSGVGGDVWIEYKFVAKPPVRANLRPSQLLSDLQSVWLHERHEEGRNVAVIIGCPEGGLLLTDLAWEREYTAGEFKSLLRTKQELAQWIIQATL